MTTEVIEAVVDQITYTNSAFATSVTTGEVVFVNSRIVNAVGLQIGDTRNFFVIPNYPDKQEQVAWRAMRVECDADKLRTEPATAAPRKIIKDLLDDNNPMTVQKIMDKTGFNEAIIMASLKSLTEHGEAETAIVVSKKGQTEYYCSNFDWFDDEE
jgi:hypothetical protein